MPLRQLTVRLSDLAKDNALTNYLTRHSVYYGRTARIVREIRNNTTGADTKVAELLSRAISWARSTEYGRQFGSNLSDWPILTKSDVLAQPTNFKRPWQISVPASTGGSTGRPLRLWRSLECISAEQAVVDSLLGDGALPMLEQKVAVLRADYVKDPADTAPPYGVWRNRDRWLVLSNAHLSRTTLSWFVEALVAFKPDVLWVYPTALQNLLHLANQTNVEIRVPTVFSSSEMMTEGLFSHAQEALGAHVIDRYGHGERSCSAHCSGTREYFFDRAYGFVELFPDTADGRCEAQHTARIVATGYWNSAFPLIRYETGDRAILPGPPDPELLELVAQGKRSFPGIIGRTDDYVIGRDGEVVTGMNHIPRELDSVLKIQVIQENDSHIRLLVLPVRDLSARDRQTIEFNARQMLPPYMELDIEAVDELQSLPNGKTPFIIRKI